MQEKQFYISITGLRLRSPIYFFTFWWHAIRSMMQAKAAFGNVMADAKRIEGVQHTLSVWESEQDMRQFLTQGAHLKAMRSFTRIATGKTYGYQSSSIPDWVTARRLWDEHGKTYNE